MATQRNSVPGENRHCMIHFKPCLCFKETWYSWNDDRLEREAGQLGDMQRLVIGRTGKKPDFKCHERNPPVSWDLGFPELSNSFPRRFPLILPVRPEP